MRIAITGGTGFVGSHLTAQLLAAGHELIHLSRSKPAAGAAHIPFSIETDFDATQLAGMDCLLHAAWDLHRPESNVESSIRLLRGAKLAGVSRVVFLSSLSAFEGCKSRYGRTKLQVEEEVTKLDGCNVRLGFVCDDSGRGLSGALKKLAALPVVPLPGGGAQNLYTLRGEQLGDAFDKLFSLGMGRTVSLAHPKPVPLSAMMAAFAKEQGKRPLFLPVPWRLLWLPLKTAEAAGLQLKFRSDSLVSLMNQNPHPAFPELEEWGIECSAFRPEFA